MIPIVDNLYTFTGLLVGRVYAISDADGITIIDAGLALAAPKILAQLQAAGHAPSAVKRILVTHAHPDHVGGLPALAAATGAAVYCSEPEKPYTEGTIPVKRADPAAVTGIDKLMVSGKASAMPGTPVTTTLADEQMLPDVFADKGGLQAIYTPGHSGGHTSYWQPTLRLIITGDVIMAMPGAVGTFRDRATGLGLPFPAFTPDMEQNKRSVRRLAEMDIQIACFGHGQPILGGAAARIRGFASRLP